MKVKKLFTLALTLVMGVVLSLSLAAQEYVENLDSVYDEVKMNKMKNNIINILQKNNSLDVICYGIISDIKQKDLNKLKEDLNKISVEEFYSRYQCALETIPLILANETQEGSNDRKMTKEFIKKFRHVDNLMVTYRHGGTVVKETLLGYIVDYYMVNAFSNIDSEEYKRALDFADFLISQGADLDEEITIRPLEKDSIRNHIKKYVAQNKDKTTKQFLRKHKKAVNTQNESDKAYHKKIKDILIKTATIESSCDDIAYYLEGDASNNLKAILNKFSLEEFYSNNTCIDNIHQLLVLAQYGKHPYTPTLIFIEKFGHPDYLFVNQYIPEEDRTVYQQLPDGSILIEEIPEGQRIIKTLLADWSTSSATQQNKSIEFAKFLIERAGANVYEQIIVYPYGKNRKHTIRVLVRK